MLSWPVYENTFFHINVGGMRSRPHFLPQHSKIVHLLTYEDLLSLDSIYLSHKIAIVL